MNLKINRGVIFCGMVGLMIVGALSWWVYRQIEPRLFALDAQTGHVQWSVALPGPVKYLPKVVAGKGEVIVSLVRKDETRNIETRHLLAFNTTSGQQLWEFVPDIEMPVGQDISADDIPAVIGDRVYVRLQDKNNTLAALDATNGKVKWTQTGAISRLINPHVAIRPAGERLVALFLENGEYSLHLLDAQTGTRLQEIQRWADAENFNFFDQEPGLLSNDQTIFLLTSQTIYAFDVQTGTPRFQIKGYSLYNAHISLAETTLSATDGRHIKAYDALTGAELWAYSGDDLSERAYFTTLQASTETVYTFCDCAKEEGCAFAFDSQSGNKRWDQWITHETGLAAFQQISSTTDTVFMPGGSHDQPIVLALSARDGAKRWQFLAPVASFTGPATNGEQVFIANNFSRGQNWLSILFSGWQ